MILYFLMPIFIYECFSGGVFLMCFVCVLVYNGIFSWGWAYMVSGMGGDLEIKNIQNKFIFFVLFHVEDIKNTCIVVTCANVEDVEDI